jgi:hypothetical protein
MIKSTHLDTVKHKFTRLEKAENCTSGGRICTYFIHEKLKIRNVVKISPLTHTNQ